MPKRFGFARNLLIVPYGIETSPSGRPRADAPAFNRTIWNWNVLVLAEELQPAPFNRTIWNWNDHWNRNSYYRHNLLIVPYGIETTVSSSFLRRVALLIVPYGIETSLSPAPWSGPWCLLIVPYGIETSYRHSGKGAAELLIVPYGIETTNCQYQTLSLSAI